MSPDEVREALYAAARKLTEDRLDAGEPFNPHREGVDTVLAHLEQVYGLHEQRVARHGGYWYPALREPVYRIRKP